MAATTTEVIIPNYLSAGPPTEAERNWDALYDELSGLLTDPEHKRLLGELEDATSARVDEMAHLSVGIMFHWKNGDVR